MNHRPSSRNARRALVSGGSLILMSGLVAAQPTLPGPKPELKPTTPTPTLACRVDPSVTDILFAIMSQTSPTTGTVKVTGVVTNRGSRDFVSQIQQQSIQLFENGVLKLTKPFQYLQPNGQEFVVYERNWNTAAHAQGGNPPSYRVRIVYSDDVLTDNNPDNNDCNLTNNLKLRSGQRLNDMF
jgi:hypothetical protein